MSYPPPRPPAHGFQPSGPPRPGPGPNAVLAFHGSVDRSDIVRRAFGAAVVTVCAAQFFSWLSSLLFVSSADDFLQEMVFYLLPFPLTPILFGLFARLFRVPSARGATWLGLLFYVLVVAFFLLGVFFSAFMVLLPLSNLGSVLLLGNVASSFGPLLPNLLVTLVAFVPAALAVGVSSSKRSV